MVEASFFLTMVEIKGAIYYPSSKINENSFHYNCLPFDIFVIV